MRTTLNATQATRIMSTPSSHIYNQHLMDPHAVTLRDTSLQDPRVPRPTPLAN